MSSTSPTPATQVRRPWHATLRTFLQALFAGALVVGVVVPQIIDAILAESGQVLPESVHSVLLGASAVVAAVAAVATRIMAIPQVEAWLQSKAAPLSAAGRRAFE